MWRERERERSVLLTTLGFQIKQRQWQINEMLVWSSGGMAVAG
jgi:hypothetical protein